MDPKLDHEEASDLAAIVHTADKEAGSWIGQTGLLLGEDRRERLDLGFGEQTDGRCFRIGRRRRGSSRLRAASGSVSGPKAAPTEGGAGGMARSSPRAAATAPVLGLLSPRAQAMYAAATASATVTARSCNTAAARKGKGV